MQQLSGRDLLDLQAQASAGGAEPGPLLLDVREPWELAIARVRLEGLASAHIPVNDLPGRWRELDPAQPVVCICHHGVRSAQAARFLERQGVEVVYNLAGGIAAWSDEVDAAMPRY